MSTGAAIGAASRRAERRLVEHLREAGAMSPASASAIADQRWMGKRALSRMLAAGAIREEKGGYYLDETIYDAYRARRKRNAIVFVGIAVVIAIVVSFWASQR